MCRWWHIINVKWNDIVEAIREEDNFSSISGLNLNKTQCQGLWLGSDKNRQQKIQIENIPFNKGVIKCFGQYYENKKGEEDEQEWIQRLKNMDKILKGWKVKIISIKGKIIVINSFVLSKVIHKFHLEWPPSWVVKETENK